MLRLTRREFLARAGLGMAWVTAGGCGVARATAAARKPNIVFIMADDLGYAELGCYGQEKIRTPHIDHLAAEGMRFTDHYSGAPVCAPARCVLMTGCHTGHAFVRGNLGRPRIGQLPIPDETVTLAERLKAEGYRTFATGKWGLGGPGTSGHPCRQGFDGWFGYLDQWNAHSHYPEYMWRDDEKVVLEGNLDGKQAEYSHDLFTREALRFIREAAGGSAPFFCYVAYAVPHVSLQVPEDSLAEYKGKWPEKPFEGGHYAAHPTPRAAYAAMVTRMDRDVGRIAALLKELGVDRETLVVFTSDNGPTFAGGADSAFFESAGPLRGLKGSLYEGGIRVPMVARWPGHVAAGATSRLPCAFCDWMPTLLDLAGGRTPEDADGVSFAPTLLGAGVQRRHEYLYWEHVGYGGWQAVRMKRWKGVRKNIRKGNEAVELYDLAEDVGETRDLAGKRPEVVRRVERIMNEGRTHSAYFPLRGGSEERAAWLERARKRSKEMMQPGWVRKGTGGA